jgi:hypothetical protein
MALGRGSALVLLVCFFVLHSELAHAVTYTVGGAGGWTFNTVGWPQGKRFRAGDTLGMYTYIFLSLKYFMKFHFFSICTKFSMPDV